MYKLTISALSILIVLMASHVVLPGGMVFADLVADQEAKLKADLAQIEKEIEQQKGVLQLQQVRSKTLEQEVTRLNVEIKKAQLTIQSRSIAINKLAGEIEDKAKTIIQLDEKVERQKESLAQLVRKKNEYESFSMVEMVLSNQDLSNFFADIDSYDTIKSSLHESFNIIRAAKAQIEKEQISLTAKRDQETNARMEAEAERRVVEKNEKERQRLLAASRGEEKTFQTMIKEREKKAAEIRAALFALRDSAAIPFGTALMYANSAFNSTGVRPAFLLAILQQESNLGQNVGTCNRPGDPAEKHWSVIMPGPLDQAAGQSRRDDQSIFLNIMEELGLSPEGRPLSCPWGNGWGGAMGPAQFIPTTWNLYKTRVATALGKTVANPWLAQDAFMASSLFLRDIGAAGGTYTAERNAACRYYSGRVCDNKQPANAFYGDQVMKRAQNIQENMIDLLSGY